MRLSLLVGLLALTACEQPDPSAPVEEYSVLHDARLDGAWYSLPPSKENTSDADIEFGDGLMWITRTTNETIASFVFDGIQPESSSAEGDENPESPNPQTEQKKAAQETGLILSQRVELVRTGQPGYALARELISPVGFGEFDEEEFYAFRYCLANNQNLLVWTLDEDDIIEMFHQKNELDEEDVPDLTIELVRDLLKRKELRDPMEYEWIEFSRMRPSEQNGLPGRLLPTCATER